MSLFTGLFTALRSGAITDQEWGEIRTNLIAADLGVKLVDQVIATAKSVRPEDAKTAISQVILTWLSKKDRRLITEGNSLKTILIVGVNGTGKTTSAAKIAGVLKNNGNTVLLAAADTFRAAATDQLQTWAERIKTEVVIGSVNSDPASVAFSAVTKAKEGNYDYLIVDTAGRLHTKQNLMAELGKVIKVIEKQSSVDEILLVIDATTGQNGMNQAKVFIESVGITGFIITKLDGSAKGGVALAIEKESGLPIKFVAAGEQISDLAPFDPDRYIQALFG